LNYRFELIITLYKIKKLIFSHLPCQRPRRKWPMYEIR